MPDYAWTCFACDQANPAGTQRCVHCGFSGAASAPEIQAARRAQGLETEASSAAPEQQVKTSAPEPVGPVQVFWCFMFGAYCLTGAYSSISRDEWPIYMLPQLDIFGGLLGPFGGGVVTGALGIFSLLLALILARKMVTQG